MRKGNNKKIILLKTLIIILILLLIIIISIYFAQFNIFKSLFNQNNSDAKLIYDINKSNNNFTKSCNEFFENKFQDLVSKYKSNLITYEELQQEISKFSAYKDYSNEILDIKKQKEKFEKAEKYFIDKDYKNALLLYSELDNNYWNLSEKKEECKKEIRIEIIENANKLKEEENYSDAIKQIEEVQDFYSEDKEVQDLLAKLRELRQNQIQQEDKNKKIEQIKSSIKVTKVWTGSPNSAGGVDLYINWKNLSNNVIKYAYFTVVPYNSVNDIVTCSIRHYSRFTAQDDGPYGKGKGNKGTAYYWENAWYNYTIKRAELKEVEIEYMDGTSLSISEEYIKYIT